MSPLYRFGKVDFFGVVTPGFCFLVALVLIISKTTLSQTPELLKRLQTWPTAILILLGAYVLGSIFRTIPVDYADKAGCWLQPKLWFDRAKTQNAVSLPECSAENARSRFHDVQAEGMP